MIRRHPTKLLALALVALVAGLVFAHVTRPTFPVAPTAAPRPGDSLVVVGVGGVSWHDVSAADTPVLWGMLRDGSAAGVSVKAMGLTTCPTDGWATLGAGEAAGPPAVGDRAGCSALPSVPGDEQRGHRVAGFDAIARASRNGPHEARLGLLGDSLATGSACVQAVGPGAALAAATSDGRVGHYAPFSVTTLSSDLARCPVALVDIGALTVDGAAAPQRALRINALEQRLTRVLDTAPTGADIIVVGVSDLGTEPGLRILAATGPHYPPGTLRSASTRTDGVAQLSDVTASILARGGVQPIEAIGGRALTVSASADNSESTAQDKLIALTDMESKTDAMQRIVTPFLVVWLGGTVLVMLGLAWTWRTAHPWDARLTRTRVLRLVRLTALLAAAMPAATFLANLVPWWRWSSSTGVLVAVLGLIVLAISAVLTLISRAGPWGTSPLGPLAAISAMTAGVIGVDLVTGSHLQIASIFGLQPLVGGRFYGMGNVAFALYASAVLLLCAALAHALIRRGAARLAIVSTVVIGAVALAVDALPAWGADFGGPIALVPALGLLLLAVAEVRPRPRNLVVIVVVAGLVVGVVAYLDWLRPPEQRSHPGRFVQTLLDGGAWDVIWRKLVQNADLLVAQPLLLIISLAAFVLVVAIVMRPGALGTAPFARLVGEAPLLRHGLIAIFVMAIIGFVTNDSGAAIPPVAGIYTLPLVVAATIHHMSIEWQRHPVRHRRDRHLL